MLTIEQRENFIKLLGRGNVLGNKTDAELLEAGLDLADLSDVVETHESLSDFSVTHGAPRNTVQYGRLTMYQWTNIQLRGKGTPRGTLYLVEFDGVSGAYFR